MPSEMVDLIDRCQKDPLFFCTEVLGCEPWPKQVEIMESVRENRATAVPSCHSSGKSWIAARIVLWFLYSFPDSKVITTAPTDRQIRGILWGEVHQARANAKVDLGGYHTVQRIELEENWWAWGFTAPDYDPNRFQGFHAPHILVVVDEAAGISNALAQQIDSILSGGHSRKLEIGNPVLAGTAFEDSCNSKLVNTLPISAFDTPNFTHFGITEEDMLEERWEEKVTDEYPSDFLISPLWAAERLEVWGPNSEAWKTRVKGEFPDIVEGAYYAAECKKIMETGLVGEFPHDPDNPVITAWDIGVRDATSIWFGQWQGPHFTLIDYHEDVDKGIQHYAKVLQEKGYVYSRHIAPHDMATREWGSAGRSRLDIAQGLGINFVINEKIKVRQGTEVNEGIDRVRGLFNKVRFNESTTKDGFACLRNYRRAISPVTGEMKPAPVHDWASHGADAFRYLAIGLGQKPGLVNRPQVNTSWVT